MFNNKEIIKKLESQRDSLIEQSNKNFLGFEADLKSKFDGSLSFINEATLWKDNINALTESYEKNKEDIKIAFQILNKEEDNGLIKEGEYHKECIRYLKSKVEGTVRAFLDEYNINQTEFVNKQMLNISVPNLNMSDITLNIGKKDLGSRKRFSDISNVVDSNRLISSEINEIKSNNNISDSINFVKADISEIKIEEGKNQTKDTNLLKEIKIISLSELNESKTDNERKELDLRFKFKDGFKSAVKQREPLNDHGVKISHSQLPDFKRKKSPTSTTLILMSPEKHSRQITTLIQSNREKNKEEKIRNKIQTQTNLKERKIKKPFTIVSDVLKEKALKKLLEGKSAEIIKNLIKGDVTCLELSYNSRLIRFKGYTCYGIG